MRIGAVSYLNTKPLIWGLQDLLPEATLVLDLPSRLADRLATGELDVALAPSIELALHPEWTIISSACIGSRGPVLSVKLMFRKPPGSVETLALDEGSRTSCALAQILLDEQYGVRPRLISLPMGAAVDQVDADAVLVIGDRAIRAAAGEWAEIWDLGDRWRQWAKLPFVFAMWAARPGVDLLEVEDALNGARDAGCEHIDAIADEESRALNLPRELVATYLRDHLNFHFDTAEQRGLVRFFDRAATLGLIPKAPELDFDDRPSLHQ